MLFRQWRGALFQNWRVYFAGIDIRNANAFATHFVGNAGAQRSHREFTGGVCDATQGDGSLACDARDVDDRAVLARSHLWQDGVDAVVSAGGIDGHDLIPLFGSHRVDRAILDIDAGCVHQDVYLPNGFFEPFKERFYAVSICHIHGEPYDSFV